MNIKKIFQSKTFLGILYGIGISLILLAIFQAGVFIGYHKAGFSYRFGDNYYSAFGGRRMGMGPDDQMMAHGTVGKIIKLDLPTFVIEGPDKVEKIIRISDDADIHLFRDDIEPAGLKLGMQVVVIGSPNSQGEIEAKLIRIMPPFATSTPSTK